MSRSTARNNATTQECRRLARFCPQEPLHRSRQEGERDARAPGPWATAHCSQPRRPCILPRRLRGRLAHEHPSPVRADYGRCCHLSPCLLQPCLIQRCPPQRGPARRKSSACRPLSTPWPRRRVWPAARQRPPRPIASRRRTLSPRPPRNWETPPEPGGPQAALAEARAADGAGDRGTRERALADLRRELAQ
jgi:hypothetical protein